MVSKCANNCCLTAHHPQEGKLFRFDLDLGSRSGKDVHKTEYLWLCPRCAQLMQPKVEVTGNSVILRLTKLDLPDNKAFLQRAN